MVTEERRESGRPGIAVDAYGGGVIDPTKNVLDLVDAAVKRIDDVGRLRALLVDVQIAHQAEIGRLRADYQTAIDALEAKRLDAIRQVDQLAVKTEADRSAAAITALATTAATTAETLRNAVNTSATNLATQLTNTVNAITERIAQLEKLSYTGQGRQAVSDPQIERLSQMVEALARSQATSGGKSEGIGMSWSVLLAGVALIGGLLAISGRLTPSVAPPQILVAPPATIATPAK